MRTITPMLFVIALGVAAMMWGMSGFGAMYGSGQSDLESADTVNASSSNSSVGGFSADAGPNEGGNILGLIFSGLTRVVDLVAFVVLLPAELHTLGAPWWFAFPLGAVAQVIVGIGVFEFASQREWT